MNNIKIQTATFKDIKNIKELMIEALKLDPLAFSVNVEEYEDNSEDWWNSYITPYMFSAKDRMFLAYKEDKLTGMIGIVYDYKKRRKHSATIVWFYVLPEFRNQGIGRELLTKAIDNAKEDQNIIKITLLVNSQQENALKIYKEFGFKNNGKLEKELKVGDIFVDTIIMEKFL